MLHRLGALLTWLRSRPPYERRLLAISSYLSISAVILAIGLLSLRDTVLGIASINPSVPSLSGGMPAAAAEETQKASGSRLATPLGTLVQTLGRAAAGLIGEKTRDGITDQAERAATTVNPSPAESLSATPPAVRPASALAPPRESPPLPSLPSAARMVAEIGPTAAGSPATLAALLRPPPPSARASIMDIISFWR